MQLKPRRMWRQPPDSHWAFHNIEQIVETAEIIGAPDEAEPIHEAESKWALPFLLRMTRPDACVILHRGRIVLERYANGNHRESRHIVMSSTKAVVGLLAAILSSKGLVDLNATVERYIPKLLETRYAGVTLRDLLDMRVDIALKPTELRAYALATNWEPSDVTPPDASLRKFLADLKGGSAGGSKPFKYLSLNTDLLGWALEECTGRSIADLITEHVWRPLGAEYPACITLDPQGLARSAGGLCVTAIDLARLGAKMIESVKRESGGFVPASLIEDIRHGGDPAAWRDGGWFWLFSAIGRGISYRNGWYSVAGYPAHVFAMGVHGQNLFIDFERDLVLVKLSSWGAAFDVPRWLATHWGFWRLQQRVSARS